VYIYKAQMYNQESSQELNKIKKKIVNFKARNETDEET